MTKVTRSIYQSVVEQNKKLLADIKLLVEDGPASAKKLLCIHRWREKFREEKEFQELLKEMLTKTK